MATWIRGIVLLFALSLTAYAAGADAPAAKRLAIPDAAAVQKADQLMHQAFAEDFAGRGAADRQALAKKLLEKSDAAQDDPAVRYVMLTAARDLATDTGDLATAMTAVEAMGAAYAVDGLGMKISTLSAIDRATRANPPADLAQACLNLAYPIFSKGKFEETAKLAALAEGAARRASDSSTVEAARELLTDARRLTSASAALARNPQDRAAAATMGAYLCFVPGDWSKGLPLLARGSDAALAAIAARDLKNPAGADAQFDLANDWWSAAAKQPSIYQNGAEAHASDLYRKSIPGLKSLSRSIAEKRAAAHPPPNGAPQSQPAASALPRPFKNSLGMVFISIPLDPNGFEMGSPAGETGRNVDELQHHVKLTRPFWIATTTVTVAQFTAFVEATGYETGSQRQKYAMSWKDAGFQQGPNHPVVFVSWTDTKSFCEWLSRKEGRQYRLPTEAEWEYAARGGTKTAFFWGNNPDGGKGFANCADLRLRRNSRYEKGAVQIFNWDDGYDCTAPVASFKPNPYGLYDMSGNVAQWCLDYYAPYAPDDATDPINSTPSSGSRRAVRGGGWFNGPDFTRVANRQYLGNGGYGPDLGFRLCIETPDVKILPAPGAPAGAGDVKPLDLSKMGFKNSVGMTMVRIPLDPDGFDMGSPPTETERQDNETLHHVKLTRTFWMATTPVTVDQFGQFVKESGFVTDVENKVGLQYLPRPSFWENHSWRNPDFTQSGDCPVMAVSWNDARAYCKWLSEKEKRHYRLPTEAEWEYAARAGSKTTYFWGDDPNGGKGFLNAADVSTIAILTVPPKTFFNWSDGFRTTAPVGRFKPNRYGLYDMLGNAGQWCEDYWGDYPEGESVDPAGPKPPVEREIHVIRGSGWAAEPASCRVAHRSHHYAWAVDNQVGFRVCADSAEAGK